MKKPASPWSIEVRARVRNAKVVVTLPDGSEHARDLWDVVFKHADGRAYVVERGLFADDSPETMVAWVDELHRHIDEAETEEEAAARERFDALRGELVGEG